MKVHEYRITFKAGDGITFFAYHSGTCEADAIKELFEDVERHGCPPFFPDAKHIEKIENIECTH